MRHWPIALSAAGTLGLGALTTAFGQVFHGAGHGWLSAVYCSQWAVVVALASVAAWPAAGTPWGRYVLWFGPVGMVILSLCLVVGSVWEGIEIGGSVQRVFKLYPQIGFLWAGMWIAWQACGFFLFSRLRQRSRTVL